MVGRCSDGLALQVEMNPKCMGATIFSGKTAPQIIEMTKYSKSPNIDGMLAEAPLTKIGVCGL